MKQNIEININDYLSEEDKKELAENLFKEELRKGFLTREKDKRIDNYERVITNAVYYYLNREIDSMLGSDWKIILKKAVKRVFTKSIDYHVFRNANLWGDKKSIAQEMLDELVLENRELAEKKVKEGLENLDMSNLEDYFVDVLKDTILEKLKS